MPEPDDKHLRFLAHLTPLQGVLEAFCRKGLINNSKADDVLQEAVTRAYRDFGLFAEGTNFRAWIFRYAYIVLLETNRQEARSSFSQLEEKHVTKTEGWELPPGESVLGVLLESPEQVLDQCGDDVNRAIQNLKPVDRSVLLLHSIGEFKYREIAQIVEIPLGTVMSSLSRARKLMREELRNHRNASDAPGSGGGGARASGDR